MPLSQLHATTIAAMYNAECLVGAKPHMMHGEDAVPIKAEQQAQVARALPHSMPTDANPDADRHKLRVS